jgi:hypothetical protein
MRCCEYGLFLSIRARLNSVDRDKHSSLFDLGVIDEFKRFLVPAPGANFMELFSLINFTTGTNTLAYSAHP